MTSWETHVPRRWETDGGGYYLETFPGRFEFWKNGHRWAAWSRQPETKRHRREVLPALRAAERRLKKLA